MGKKNIATTLLALLKHSTADRLEAMLDPATLLVLFAHYGRSSDDMRGKLEGGTLPGELLLELFEEHGADAVWLMVPARVQSRVDAGEDREAEAHSDLTRALEEASGSERIGMIMVLCGCVWSAMSVLGSFPEWGTGLTLGPLTFGVVAGAAGGAMSRRSARTASSLGGMFAALCTIFSAWVGTHFVDGEPSRWVVLAVILPALLPAGLMYRFLLRSLERKDAPNSF